MPEAPRDIWKKLEELNSEVWAVRPGPEWFTTTEYAEKFGITRQKAAERIYRLRNQGKLEISKKGRPAYFRVKR